MMFQQRKAVMLFTAIVALAAFVFGLGLPCAAADTPVLDKMMQKVFERSSKDAFNLLQREAARPHPDWAVTATVKSERWVFPIKYAKSKSLLLPVLKGDGSTAAPPIPPLYDLVVPVSESVGMIVTSNDDMYPLEVPGLGIKTTAIPGRLAQVSINTKQPGVYPASCPAPCGPRDKAMAFAIHVVEMGTFKHWLAVKYAADATQPNR